MPRASLPQRAGRPAPCGGGAHGVPAPRQTQPNWWWSKRGWGDAVGTFVALLELPPTLAVLNAVTPVGRGRGGSAPATRRYRDNAPNCTHGCTPGCPSTPPSTCHDTPQRLHQLHGCSHGAPSFDPLVHKEDTQTWEGAEAAAERSVPTLAAPSRHDGSTPLTHPVRRHRCRSPSPSLGLSSRCRAAPASARRGAQLCRWPGSLSTAWQQQQCLGVGTAPSGPVGMRDGDPGLTCIHAHPG